MIVGAQVAAVADGQGNRLGTMIVLRDVTRDALAERLKDQFVTAISHELRTPMAVIKGMSDVIMGQPADRPPPRRMLETLSRNVDILDRMIVELLDIAEMSETAFSVRHDQLDLEELLWNVVNGMTPEVKRAKLDVSVMARDTDRLQVAGDDQRLRWALGHLLQNSIRYTESGGHIIITASLTDDKHATIQVVDTGVGIAKKDLPHIFDRFYRGEPRTSSGKLLDPRGLGQGLFVARTVTESHGGYLSVKSEVGHGSIFTMVLPVAS
jgi:two-component system phosphate regulon sensor histidine kinase PhoR